GRVPRIDQRIRQYLQGVLLYLQRLQYAPADGGLCMQLPEACTAEANEHDIKHTVHHIRIFNAKGISVFHPKCKAFAKSYKSLKTISIAGWGSVGASLVVLRNTVCMPAFLPNSISLILFPTIMLRE